MKKIMLKDHYEITLLSITINLLILRIALPFMEFLFIPAFTLFAFYLLYKLLHTKNKFQIFIRYLYNYWSFLVVCLFFIIGFFISDKFNTQIIRELFILFIILIISFGFFFFIDNKEALEIFYKRAWQQAIFILTISGTLGIAKFLVLFFNIDSVLIKINYTFDLGTSLRADYNFYALGGILGFLLLLFLISKPQETISKVLYQLHLFCFVLSVALSNSRRGIFILTIIIFLIIISRIVSRFNTKYHILLTLRKNTNILIAIIIIIPILFIGTFHFSSDKLKDYLAEKIVKNKVALKDNVSRMAHRYMTTIDGSLTGGDIYKMLWQQDIRNMDEFSFYERFRQNTKDLLDSLFLPQEEPKITYKNLIANGNFKDSLNGWQNWGHAVSLVKPSGSDTLSNYLFIYSEDHYGGVSNTVNVSKGDTLTFHAYVKVIKWNYDLRLMIREHDGEKYRKVKPKKEWEADNKWHTLGRTIIYDIDGEIGFWIGGGGKPNESISLWTNIQVEKGAKPTTFKAQGSDTKYYVLDSEPLNLDKYVAKEHLGGTLADLAKVNNENVNKPRSKEERQLYSKKRNFVKNLIDKSFISSRNYLRDTVSVIREEKAYRSEVFFGPRIDRLRYALELFQSDYSLVNKLFGKGFDYLQLYGNRFYRSPLRSDTPHNFLVSALLYSGIFGAAFVIFFIVEGFIIYIRQLKYKPILFFSYLVTLFFVFFSGNSLFDIPIFTFLTIFPFLIKHLYVKGEI